MHVLLPAIGSSGDVFPMIGLAAALAARGHRATLIANDEFEVHARRLGLDFVSVGTREQFREVIEDPLLWDWRKCLPVIAHRLMLPAMRPVCEAILRLHVPGQTVVATSLVALGARMARELIDVPLVTVNICPSCFRSCHDAPQWHPHFLRSLPRLLIRLQYWLTDVTVIEPTLAGPVNAIRAKHGLRPTQGILREWVFSPDLVLGLFPDWYWAPQPDWPSRTHLTGFVMYDGQPVTPASEELRDFIEAGEPPVAFTAGSAMLDVGEFFSQCVEACRRLGRRGLLMTPFADRVPADLPAEVRQAYAPFSWLLPRVAAIVHHGGIGTTARALAAGRPQLVMPMAHDQFDNAWRVQRLGVGDTLSREAFRGPEIARRLGALLESPKVADACRKWAAQIPPPEVALDKACRWIEQAGQSKPASKAA